MAAFKDKITRHLVSISKDTKKVPRLAYEYWKKITPRKTGNAKRSTKFKGGDTISASYEYASYLDNGHSKQAPKGMSKPTAKYIKDLFNDIKRKN